MSDFATLAKNQKKKKTLGQELRKSLRKQIKKGI